MELRLVVGAADGRSRDVAIDAKPDTELGAVASALASHLSGASGAWTLKVRRFRSVLDPGMALDRSGLRVGDEVELVSSAANAPSPVDADDAVEFTVTSERLAGTVWRLRAGACLIGRDAASKLFIDDPAVSRSHAELTIGGDGKVSILDLGSKNGTFVNQRRIDGIQALCSGDVIAVGTTTLALTVLVPLVAPANQEPAQGIFDGTIRFNRPPRVARRQPQLSFNVDVPAATGSGGRLPISASIVPLGVAGVLFATTRQPAMLLFGALSPLMAVFSLIENKIRGGRGDHRSASAFRHGLDAQEQLWISGLDEERERRNDASPSVPELLRRATQLDTRLWERRRDSPDFLDMRVGLGDVPTPLTVTIGRGNETLIAEAQERTQQHSVLENVAVSVNLAALGSIALGGTPAEVVALGRSLAAQIAGLHSPRDVVLVAALAEATDDWRWLGWLPHVWTETSPLRGAHVVAGPDEAQALVNRVLSLIDGLRQETRSPRDHDWVETPRVVVIVEEGCRVPRALVSRLLEQGPAQGVFTIWLGTKMASLPGECGAFVEVPDGKACVITEPRPGINTTCDRREGLDTPEALRLALCLAPIRDASSRSADEDVPTLVSLVNLLALGTAPEARIETMWHGAHGLLDAPVGVGALGTFSISLRRDGPHALIGGATKAGKSELLQTIVASLAANHPPSRLTFLLVDYKGGTSLQQCVDLPHVVGVVTSLDEHLAERALRSLRAELKWRESVLSRARVRSLADLENAAPGTAPPSLVIVVDEYSTLISEVPEFVDGAIAIAALGRSLGIHLILATQQPGGTISDKIKVNTNLRIALQFTDDQDSRNVINSGAATRPGLPQGRAFARVGSGAVTEFQSAFPGGRTAPDLEARPVIRDLLFGGVVDAVTPKGPEAAVDTDLEVVVDAATSLASRLELPPLRRPWLPELPTVVLWNEVVVANEGDATAVLGLVDLPDRQEQHYQTWGPRVDGNMMVYGASGAGKTSLIRTIAAGLASSARPDDLHLYAVDYAAPSLAGLTALPHCGEVIRGSDVERTTRLLDMLRSQLDRRRDQLADAGADDIAAFIKKGGAMSRIVVFIDGFAGLVSAVGQQEYGAYLETLATVAMDGKSAGIHLVVTVDRRAAVTSKMAAACEQRMIMRQSGDDDYAMLGLEREVYRGVQIAPGRAFMNKGVEIQCAVFGGPDASAQNEALRALGDEIRARHGVGTAARIHTLPTAVSADDLPAPTDRETAVVGLRGSDLAPLSITLTDGPFVIVGPPLSGRSTALGAIAISLSRYQTPPALHLLSPRRKTPLLALDVWQDSHVGIEACMTGATALVQRLSTSAPGGEPVVVVIDNAEELLDSPVADALEVLVRRGADVGFYVVASIEVAIARTAYTPWVKSMLRHRTGMLLNPDPMADAGILGYVKLLRRDQSQGAPGRGYVVRRGVATAVQIAIP